jgi:hypothetical protein
MLGFVATFGTVLGLGAAGGGAEIARRNALGDLQVAGLLVFVAVFLAALAVLVAGDSNSWVRTGLLTLSVAIGISGLALAGWAITQRPTPRPAIALRIKGGASPSIVITVRAGGLATKQDLNLVAKAYKNRFGEDAPGGQRRLIREAFGPDPVGDAALVAEVPIPTGVEFQTIVIRAWVGGPEDSGPCLFQRTIGPVSGGPGRVVFKKAPKTGCVIVSLADLR